MCEILFPYSSSKVTHTRMSQIRNHDVCQCVLVRISSGCQTCLKQKILLQAVAEGSHPQTLMQGWVIAAARRQWVSQLGKRFTKCGGDKMLKDFARSIHSQQLHHLLPTQQAEKKPEGPAETGGTSRLLSQQSQQSHTTTKWEPVLQSHTKRALCMLL